MKADTKELIRFLVGLAWTGVVVWFTATSYPHIDELGFVILFTSGAFGWMSLALSAYPKAPVLWSLATFLTTSITIGVCVMVVRLVMEQGILMNLLGVILYVGVLGLLTGIVWLVWWTICRIKR